MSNHTRIEDDYYELEWDLFKKQWFTKDKKSSYSKIPFISIVDSNGKQRWHATVGCRTVPMYNGLI